MRNSTGMRGGEGTLLRRFLRAKTARLRNAPALRNLLN
jgi:hypothetical protein